MKMSVFEPGDFMHYVCSLHTETADTYGDAEWASGRTLAWWPFWIDQIIGAPKEEIILIAENAEVVLLSALADAKPELNIIDDEFLRFG